MAAVGSFASRCDAINTVLNGYLPRELSPIIVDYIPSVEQAFKQLKDLAYFVAYTVKAAGEPWHARVKSCETAAQQLAAILTAQVDLDACVNQTLEGDGFSIQNARVRTPTPYGRYDTRTKEVGLVSNNDRRFDAYSERPWGTRFYLLHNQTVFDLRVRWYGENKNQQYFHLPMNPQSGHIWDFYEEEVRTLLSKPDLTGHVLVASHGSNTRLLKVPTWEDTNDAPTAAQTATTAATAASPSN